MWVAVAVVAAVAATGVTATSGPVRPHLDHVLFVGNNWDGTADVIAPDRGFARIGRINIIPDIAERMTEILTDPVRLAYFLAIREFVGEGHDQYVDDMFTSHDGRLLVVSRPSLRDVVAIALQSADLQHPQILEMLDHYTYPAEVLVASVRNPLHVIKGAQMGAHIATCPFAVLQQLVKHPLTDVGLGRFLADWKKAQR